MSRILKPAQTVTGSARVRVYQPEPPQDAQAEAFGDGVMAGMEEEDGAGRRYALISEEKRKILEHARSQAEQSAARILEEAYAQRDNIVNTARDEAGRIREQARAEGYDAGQERALGDMAEQLEEIRRSVGLIEQEFQEFEQRLKCKTAELALKMAEKILNRRVEADETELADMIEKAVLSERDKENITLHVPAGTIRLVELLEQRLEPLRDKKGGTLRIKTEERPAGFVQVETEEGIVDASLDVQFENLKRQLAALGR